ncbi:DUF6318 family protein [Paenarthrobacter sp. NPDC058040]|uniref:DUF6318 family protein n=1 Tax=unclassified Paenarthrobacter TaxID=2634190 RepID=UPI0036DACA31
MPHRSFALIPPARASLWIRTIGLAVSAMLLLGGCQGSGTPSGTSTTTASPTSSATASRAPTPAPTAAYKPADAKGKAQNVPVPVMPALAKENTKEGLEAFIRYWYAQQNYAAETGDTKVWTDMTGHDCLACNRILKGLQDSNVNGRWLVGGKITIPAVELIWSDGAAAQQARVQIVQERTDYYNADGTEGRASQTATNSAFGVTTMYDADGWKVTDLGLIR